MQITQFECNGADPHGTRWKPYRKKRPSTGCRKRPYWKRGIVGSEDYPKLGEVGSPSSGYRDSRSRAGIFIWALVEKRKGV